MKNEKTAKRLQFALSRMNMKAQELADKSGVNKASISQYINGTHSPGNISAGKMAKHLNVNPVWLMGFDVPMGIENNDPVPVILSPDESSLLEDYRQLNSLGKDKAREYVEDLKANNKYLDKEEETSSESTA